MVVALALVLSLVLAAALASMVTSPLRHMAHATRTMARGDLGVKGARQQIGGTGCPVRNRSTPWRPGSRSRLTIWSEKSRRGKSRERELKESEARLRVSEERLQLAIDAAGLGIWDWDVEQDRLVWDDLDVPALRRSQG